MICNVTCAISIVFIIATLYMNLSVDKSKVLVKFTETLDKEQLEIYNKIMLERKKISITGYLLGLGVSLVIILVNYNRKEKIDYKAITCLVGAVMFLTHYFYYTLTPKSDWMLLHLKDEQVKKWLEMYKKMQYRYHSGLLLGLISVVILSMAFKC